MPSLQDVFVGSKPPTPVSFLVLNNKFFRYIIASSAASFFAAAYDVDTDSFASWLPEELNAGKPGVSDEDVRGIIDARGTLLRRETGAAPGPAADKTESAPISRHFSKSSMPGPDDGTLVETDAHLPIQRIMTANTHDGQVKRELDNGRRRAVPDVLDGASDGVTASTDPQVAQQDFVENRDSVDNWVKNRKEEEPKEKTEEANLGDQCRGDAGTPVGGPLCCGQIGTVDDETQLCPTDLPYCKGFVDGQTNGKCSTEPSPGQWMCHTLQPDQDDAWCQQSPVVKDKMYRYFPKLASPCGGCECCVKDMPASYVNLAGPLAVFSMASCPDPLVLLGCSCHSYTTLCLGAKMKGNRCYAWNSDEPLVDLAFGEVDQQASEIAGETAKDKGTVQAHAICGEVSGSDGWSVIESEPSEIFSGAPAIAACPLGSTLTGCTCHSKTLHSCGGVWAETKGDGVSQCRAVKHMETGDPVFAQARCGRIPASRQWTEMRSGSSGSSKGAKARVSCPEGTMLTGCSCISNVGRCDGAISHGDVCFAYNGVQGNGVVAQARCGLIPQPSHPSHLPECIYDQCNVIIVKGAGYGPVNGIYKPFYPSCSKEQGYGNTDLDSEWTGYQNSNLAELVWSWDTGATRGWYLRHKKKVRYHDYLNRLSPKKVALDSYKVFGPGGPDGGAEPPPGIECYQRELASTLEDVTEPDTASNLQWTDGWSREVTSRSADGMLHGLHGYGPRVSKMFKDLPPHDVVAISARYWCTGAWMKGPLAEVTLEEQVAWTKKRVDPMSCIGWGEYGEKRYFLSPIKIHIPGFSTGRNKHVFRKVDEKVSMSKFCFTDVATGLAHDADDFTLSFSSGGNLDTALHPLGAMHHPMGGLYAFNRLQIAVGLLKVGDPLVDEDAEQDWGLGMAYFETGDVYAGEHPEESSTFKRRASLDGSGVAKPKKGLGVFARQDLAANNTGWTQVDMVNATDSGRNFLAKLHGLFSGSTSLARTWHDVEPHTILQVQLRFYFIDRWQGEEAVIRVDQFEVWRRSHDVFYPGYCQPFRLFHENIPNPWQGDRAEDKCYTDITVALPHNSSSFTLQLFTTLPATQKVELASWGFSGLKIRIGYDSWNIQEEPPPL